ncbi:DUF2750 domain-containing protein [Seonamhaeicola marinus]|uniref:DUF2750 domain-containing protein n=1 Tax=Seonamhaeicola marinus TaxID=1912246 RepID=A0A5D0IN13_9FLAO|nr:DUF2750 domain-containing protein [Seonamhaeicola marinus]TYA84429.1 DUF2750 domain-containing protein [Seonamhaeicola marinus]
MHEKKYQNIIELNNAERYDYLIRKVADFETIYLIYEKFWQMSTSDINGIECILVFPEKNFAQEHIKLEKSKSVKKKDLYKFINWLEKDKSNKLNLAVFPNQNNEARIVNSSELKNDLLNECEQYE